jgi:hypothetical protein
MAPGPDEEPAAGLGHVVDIGRHEQARLQATGGDANGMHPVCLVWMENHEANALFYTGAHENDPTTLA